MIKGVVGLDGPDKKLASTSFGEIQFWTETWWICLEVFQDSNGVALLDLRVWLEGLQVGKISGSFEQGKLGL